MTIKIKLQKFDDNFEDYYDSEEKVFVLYAGNLGVKNASISTEAKIEDYDKVIWDCYLFSVEYISKLDMYEIKYKPYGD